MKSPCIGTRSHSGVARRPRSGMLRLAALIVAGNISTSNTIRPHAAQDVVAGIISPTAPGSSAMPVMSTRRSGRGKPGRPLRPGLSSSARNGTSLSRETLWLAPHVRLIPRFRIVRRLRDRAHDTGRETRSERRAPAWRASRILPKSGNYSSLSIRAPLPDPPFEDRDLLCRPGRGSARQMMRADFIGGFGGRCVDTPNSPRNARLRWRRQRNGCRWDFTS
jgi:hypothetical protein